MLGRMCPQAAPAWQLEAASFLPKYLTGNPNASLDANVTAAPARDPRETEDCLFLDIAVPQKIFDNRGNGSGAPVLVWIHGGGYTGGDKSNNGSPAGLIARSQLNSDDGLVFVSINYRV